MTPGRSSKLPDRTTPHDTAIEEANSRLIEGLKNCRKVVKHYQAILGGDPESATAPAPLPKIDEASR